ncbi:DTW domain-containing protein [Thiomicrorhabdus sp. HH1]|uniref:tRNA-uridine aminocarboxypropyltransferase n=1 Tax=Thiomicrorhabdus heinhorstiae TaxID=2748010 RepID=A0ABS0C2B9_9GAMM|nr:DTW domain-containing protein [Thiomicrorhabdus heinhorstiae]
MCKWVQPVANQIEFIIFQHPSEAKNAKGTARLADLMLQRSLLWIGETLQEAYCDSVELAHSGSLLEYLQSAPHVFLLYPQREGVTSPLSVSIREVASLPAGEICIVVLDATWKKSYKQLLLNPFLQALPRVELEDFDPSRYKIRKQKNDASLSTLEAIYECLCVLGEAEESRDFLLQGFDAMQQQWLEFVPKGKSCHRNPD